MSLKKKPTIAIFTTKWGHESIAQAVAEDLQGSAKIVVFNDAPQVANIYTLLYQYMPSGPKVLGPVMHSQTFSDGVLKYFQQNYHSSITAFLNQHKPDIIISTYALFGSILEPYAEQHNVPLLNILADPRTMYSVIISKHADLNVSFDAAASEYVRQLAPGVKVREVGWFVRNDFEQPYDKTAVQNELGLRPDIPVFLIVSGSEGTTAIMKVLPALLESSSPLQIVVACGNNTVLYKSLTALQKITDQFSQKTLLPLSFTTQLHRYMQAADLIIGKAGPNTLFEAVATKTPFFAITHLAGQEDGNLDIIREYNLGFVEENPLKARKLLQQLLENPQLHTSLEPNITKMAQYNARSGEKLRSIVTRLLG
ncbi:MAG: hypothetical protein H6774_01830 [Pseudomonadales bacterium]|nr:hypothetical protein [Candidatus Woesebacteria bacterium]MCB9801805.1 hypothetical protein [Pseudomonadales bacterium]